MAAMRRLAPAVLITAKTQRWSPAASAWVWKMAAASRWMTASCRSSSSVGLGE